MAVTESCDFWQLSLELVPSDQRWQSRASMSERRVEDTLSDTGHTHKALTAYCIQSSLISTSARFAKHKAELLLAGEHLRMLLG